MLKNVLAFIAVRDITAAAGVNLAAVNYHFGSKKALIQAVFVRFIDPVVEALNNELETYQHDGREPSLEELLDRVALTVLAVRLLGGVS